MRLLVLGPLEVRGPTSPIAVRRGRPRVLLHLLAMNRRVVLPVDVIADRLWGEDLPVDAANAVHQVVSYLRRSFGDQGREVIATSATGYRLDLPDEAIDAWQFERLAQSAISAVSEGTAAGAHRGLADADAATVLWRGDPFPESAEYEWAAGDIARLRDTYLQAQETRLEALLLLGRHREVVLEAQSLAAAYPLREQFHHQLVLALYRSDRQSEALEALRSVRLMLAHELGLDPGPPLQRLEKSILGQDDDLEWRPPPDASEVPPKQAEPVALADAVAAVPLPESRPAPVVPTSFLGRDEVTAAATGLLQPGRVLTIAGPGGVGKTRLASVLAAAVGAGRVWFIDLSEVQDQQLVPGTMASRLDLGAPFPHDPSERLVEAFTGVEGLLVVDNCEHVVDSVSELLPRILNVARDLTVIATSRRPIRIAEEMVLNLEPLALPAAGSSARDSLLDSPAARLFVERARMVRADFDPDEATARDIAEIVCMLDGLPLAIELAAAHADVLSPAVIRDRLEGSFDGLEAQSRTVSMRQRSLRAAIESSVVLMTLDETAFFRRLSVFAGSFDLAAAAEVAAPDGVDAYALLASLVRQSLVARDGAERYRFLEPVRRYAYERLALAGDLDDCRDRHSTYIMLLAEQADGEIRSRSQEEAIEQLHLLLPDARAALTWSLQASMPEKLGRLATAFAWFWTLQGMSDEGMRWLTAAAESEIADKQVRAKVLRCLGLLANPIGELELARRAGEESAELSRETGNRPELAAALLVLGIAEWAMGELAAAAASHDEAIEVTRDHPRSWLHCSALVLRARTALDRGEPDVGDRLQRSIDAVHVSGEKQLLGLAFALQARRHLGGGEHSTAYVLASEALRVWRMIDYKEGEMNALNLIGRVKVAQGDTTGGEARLLEALRIARRAKHPGALCESLESLAACAAATGRHEHAYLLLQVSGRKRSLLKNPVAAGQRVEMASLVEGTRSALGAAASMVEARACLLGFDDVVDQLLAVESGEPVLSVV